MLTYFQMTKTLFFVKMDEQLSLMKKIQRISAKGRFKASLIIVFSRKIEKKLKK